MQQVTLPPDILNKIGETKSELEVVNDAGQVKGYLISPEYRSLIYSWVKTLFHDDEELRQARAETGGYTTSEAISYLNQLADKHKG